LQLAASYTVLAAVITITFYAPAVRALHSLHVLHASNAHT